LANGVLLGLLGKELTRVIDVNDDLTAGKSLDFFLEYCHCLCVCVVRNTDGREREFDGLWRFCLAFGESPTEQHHRDKHDRRDFLEH